MIDIREYHDKLTIFYDSLSEEQILAVALDKINVLDAACIMDPRMYDVSKVLIPKLIRADGSYSDNEKRFSKAIDDIYAGRPGALPMKSRIFDHMYEERKIDGAIKLYGELPQFEKVLMVQVLTSVAFLDKKIAIEEKKMLDAVLDLF